MMKRILYGAICLFLSGTLVSQTPAKEALLSELDLSKMTCAMGLPKTNLSIKGDSMAMGGKRFTYGVGTHATSRMLIALDGKAQWFTAKVGLDDGAYIHANISFFVLGDKKILWQSGPVKKGEQAREVKVDLTGIKKLGLLVTVIREDISENYADWAEAKISYTGKPPVADDNEVKAKQYGLLTPAATAIPRINNAPVYAIRPGSPFLYRIPATGSRPITFTAKKLPTGLLLNKTTGIITGAVSTAGQYEVTLEAKNKFGKSQQHFKIIAGDKLALTPPMGWNSWYIHYHRVSDAFMRQAAENMITSGMADYGYQYVNIDDCWMNKEGTNNVEENGSLRNENGSILSNKRFPDMRSMTDFIHAKGLKAGIYSSPGPKTCAGYAGSYQHEQQDAETFAAWGFDFLKYDWCSYSNVSGGNTLNHLKAPFKLMGDALKKLDRDIVFNLCQYGAGDVWKWGAEYGQSWRTTGDLGVATGSFLPGFYNIGLSNAEHAPYAGPGAWNDPDYLMIGWVGNARNMSTGTKTTLTANEQYAYMSLWSLMAAPLFFSGDMAKLDSFSLNVLCNHEVIAVNQDELGAQGKIIRNDSTGMLMLKPLADGSRAIGLFNFPGNKQNPADYFVWEDKGDGSRVIKFTAEEIGVKGKFKVRNLWTQKDIGVFNNSFEMKVPYHAVLMLKIIPQ